MSNLILALAVLVAAGTVVLQQGKSLARVRSQNEQLASQHRVLRGQLAELQKRLDDLNRRLKTTQEELGGFNDEQTRATLLALESIVPADATRQGGWPDRAPFFYLPKRHLSSVGYSLLDGDRLTDDAGALFGMNPAEREAVDASYNALWQKFRDLEIQRLERVEQPEKWKNMLNSISYRIPALEKEASVLRTEFQSAVVEAVGSTRAEYLMEAFNGFLASKLEDLGQHARVISFGYVGQPNGKMQPMYGVVDETAGTTNARTFDQLEEDWPISYYARLFGVNVPINASEREQIPSSSP